MLGATFDFILSVYAFLASVGEIDSAVNVNNSHFHLSDEMNANASANASTIDDSNCGSNGVCGCCRKELHSNYFTTYAYDAREFCSINCRKKVSDEDLLALGGYMNLYIHPIDHAI
jgi:hypothetical protein